VDEAKLVDAMVSSLNLSPAALKTIAAAFRSARSKNIGAEHLFLGLMAVDPGLIANFKLKGINRFELIAHIRSLANKKCPRDQGMVVEILRLSSRIARNIPAINQHIFAALVLKPSSPVSRYLTERRIDVSDLVKKKFYFIPRALELCRDRSDTDKHESIESSETASALLTGLFAKLVEAQPVTASRARLPRVGNPVAARRYLYANPVEPAPVAPLRTQISRSENFPPSRRITLNPEQKAMSWLGELIPDQAQLYASKRFVEIQSTLHPGRYYRISRDARTRVYDAKRQIAACCIYPRDLSIPPTDRVIGEYFMIKGDENSYLKIANVTRIN